MVAAAVPPGLRGQFFGKVVLAQHTRRQNPGAQSSFAPQEFLCAGCEREVHPFAWRAFTGACKADPLDLKLNSDEGVQVDAKSDHVSPENRRRLIVKIEVRTDVFVGLEFEKCDLPFVVGLEVIESVTLDSASGDAVNFVDLEHGVLSGRFAISAEVIVSR